MLVLNNWAQVISTVCGPFPVGRFANSCPEWWPGHITEFEIAFLTVSHSFWVLALQFYICMNSSACPFKGFVKQFDLCNQNFAIASCFSFTIHYNLFITVSLGSKANTMLAKQPCCSEIKMYCLYRKKMNMNSHFLSI